MKYKVRNLGIFHKNFIFQRVAALFAHPRFNLFIFACSDWSRIASYLVILTSREVIIEQR